jgi:hypothetical protein
MKDRSSVHFPLIESWRLVGVSKYLQTNYNLELFLFSSKENGVTIVNNPKVAQCATRVVPRVKSRPFLPIGMGFFCVLKTV